jgi:replicative DNA helicase
MNNSYSIQPLKESDVRISDLVLSKPPKRKYLFNDHLPTGIVGGMIAVGGTGKSYLLLTLGMALATGTESGPLKPPKAFKVLYLAGEDPHEELHRRIFHTSQALCGDNPPKEIMENFLARSVVGEIGPLLEKDHQGNLRASQCYRWLDESLTNLPDVEVLIIDPLSKFYGLDENDNSHCAMWIACLEAVARKHKLTILFSHHESKARKGEMDQASSRGGSALTDGCRWVANLRNMTTDDGKKYSINPKDYIEFDITKNNYSSKLLTSIFFKRNSEGVLEYIDLTSCRTNSIAIELLKILQDEKAKGNFYSKRDLEFDKVGKPIIDDLTMKVLNLTRSKDIPLAVDLALSEGWLEEKPESKGRKGAPKKILHVIRIP